MYQLPASVFDKGLHLGRLPCLLFLDDATVRIILIPNIFCKDYFQIIPRLYFLIAFFHVSVTSYLHFPLYSGSHYIVQVSKITVGVYRGCIQFRVFWDGRPDDGDSMHL
jgi:hypothetical protein